MAKWSDNKPWERREDETAKAFEAFALYLHMGEKRSITRVAQELHKSRALIGRWSRQHEWQARLLKYENELRREEFEKLKRQRKDMRIRQIQTAAQLQRTALKALKDLDPATLQPKAILSFITQGAKLEAAMMEEEIRSSALESGSDGRKASLADEIVEAYRKRQEAEE